MNIQIRQEYWLAFSPDELRTMMRALRQVPESRFREEEVGPLYTAIQNARAQQQANIAKHADGMTPWEVTQ